MRAWNVTVAHPAYGISHSRIADTLTRDNWLHKAVVRRGPTSVYYIYVSQSECVGRFWLRESSQVVIQGNFHSLVGAKAVGSSGNHSNFVVESFDGAAGDLSFAWNQIKIGGLMSAQHPG